MSNGPERKYEGVNVVGPARSSPYPIQRLAAPIALVDTARAIERASTTLAGHTNAKLSVIADQIRHLQAEAQRILNKAESDLQLHRAECRFNRIIGKTYSLYRHARGHLFFSMLSPDERGNASEHQFVGSYRLEADQSWTRVDSSEEEEVRESQSKLLFNADQMDG